MKKIISFLCVIALMCSTSFVLAACGGAAEQFTLTVKDIVIEEGQTSTIAPTFSPESAAATVNYTFSGSNISIALGKVRGLIGDTETVVTASVGEVSTTFKVTVNKIVVVPPAPDAGSLLVNGNFEKGDLTAWEMSGTSVVTVEKNDADGSNVISDSYGLKLWVSASEPLNFTLKQKAVPTAEKYTYSFKIKGTVQSISLKVFNGETELFTLAQSEFISQSEARQFGLVCDFNGIADLSNIYFTVSVTGAAGAWGGLDDIKVEKGEIEMPAFQTTESKDSFVYNGGFEEGASQWTLNKTEGTLETSGNDTKFGDKKLAYYGGIATSTFKATQTRTELPNATATLSAWIISGSTENVGEIRLFASSNEVNYYQSAKILGYAAGYKKITIENIVIAAGSLSFGVEMTAGGTDLWSNIDGFELLIEGSTPTPSANAEIDDMKINGVNVTGNSTSGYAVALPTAKFDELVAATDVKTLITATCSYKATITSAVFVEATGVLSIVVTAEDKATTNSVEIIVTKEQVGSWVNVPVLHGDFEVDEWEPTDWTVTGFKWTGIIGDDKTNSGKKAIKAYGALSAATEGIITQEISHSFKAGDKVKVSAYMVAVETEIELSFIIGNSKKIIILDSSWDYNLREVEYTLKAEDIVGGKVTIGVASTSKLAEDDNSKATFYLDDVMLSIWS